MNGWEMLDELPSTLRSFTDDNVPPGRVWYNVRVPLPNPCDPTLGGRKAGTGPYYHSFSNMDDNKLEESVNTLGKFVYPLTSQDLLIYPNPVIDRVTIQFANPGYESYQFILTDLTGKVLKLMDNITGKKIEIDLNGLISGLYLIELRGPRIYRGKIVIE